MNLFRLLLEIGRVDNLREVIQKTLVVNLLVEIARINFECGLKPARRVSMCQVQVLVGQGGILAFGQLGPNIFNTILLEVMHEELVTYDNPIDV